MSALTLCIAVGYLGALFQQMITGQLDSMSSNYLPFVFNNKKVHFDTDHNRFLPMFMIKDYGEESKAFDFDIFKEN
jgi:hypothetical protein